MNILLINHYAGSLEYGMEYRHFYLAREWVKNGHNVTIVGATYSHLRVHNPQITSNMGEEYIEGIRYVWLETPKYEGNGLRRVRNMLTFLWRIFANDKYINKSFKPDVVIASSTYPLITYLAKRIADKYNAKLVYEVRDLWPLTLMELGNMSAYHPFIIAMQIAENYTYRIADKIIGSTQEMQDYIIEHGMPKRNFTYIPNGISVEDWSISAIESELPPEHGFLLAKLKKEGFFVLGYTGGHAISNALDQLISAAEHLKSEKIAIVLVGHGTEKARLIELAKLKGLDKLYFLPSVKKEYIPAVLDKMDATYIGCQDKKLYKISGLSPNKILDYMMAKKCIVHSVNITNDVVKIANCGLSAQAENTLEIANAIRNVADMSKEERRILGENGYNYVIKNHDYRVLADKFLKAME